MLVLWYQKNLYVYICVSANSLRIWEPLNWLSSGLFLFIAWFCPSLINYSLSRQIKRQGFKMGRDKKATLLQFPTDLHPCKSKQYRISMQNSVTTGTVRLWYKRVFFIDQLTALLEWTEDNNQLNKAKAIFKHIWNFSILYTDFKLLIFYA